VFRAAHHDRVAGRQGEADATGVERVLSQAGAHAVPVAVTTVKILAIPGPPQHTAVGVGDDHQQPSLAGLPGAHVRADPGQQ
jgi:hypothetical protein